MIAAGGRLAAVLALMVTLAPGCEAPPPSGHGVVSLSPALTETLWALGLGERQIGRSDFCDHPSEAEALPALGTSLAPNFEAIARLRPALILGEAGHGGFAEELRRIAPLEQLPWLSVADMRASVAALGERFGRRREAARLLQELDRGLVVDPPPAGPRVLLLLGGSGAAGPHWFMRRNSIHGAALHAAGARNAVDRDIEGNAVLSTEALLEIDPDLILILTPHPEAGALAAAFGNLTALRAARQGRIAVLAGARYLRTGPSVASLAGELAARIAALSGDGGR